jgi:hypothetical protein
MKEVVTINKKYIEFRDEKIKIDDILVHLESGRLLGIYTLDYLLEILADYNNRPSKFSIARKLKKS